MIDKELTKSWYARPSEVGAWLDTRIQEGARVLEVGPGKTPFSRATHFIDAYWDEGYAVKNIVERGVYIPCNVDLEDIPFPDKYFDFVFTSHVLEDLRYPTRLCREMSRVAKAGFSTTPSPIVEFCRGPQSAWRGQLHHNWFVYSDRSTLFFLRKNVLVEHLDFPTEEKIEKAILGNDLLAHTYHYWEGALNYVEVTPENIWTDYGDEVIKAVQSGIHGTSAFLLDIVKELKSTHPDDRALSIDLAAA